MRRKPKAANCPCCGVKLIAPGHVPKKGEPIRERNVYPICENEYTIAGGLISYVLSWECAVCRCTWRHGQDLSKVKEVKF